MTKRLAMVFAAPHRLLFLTGSINLALIAAWWLVQLTAQRFGEPHPPQGDLPAALLHAPVMLFVIFPPFMLGFLLTVFPRWMGQPDLGRRAFGPVAVLQAAGALAVHAGLWSGAAMLVMAGFGFAAVSWALAIFVLGRVAAEHRRAGQPVNWHAVSALAALLCGLLALGISSWSLGTGAGALWQLGNQIGICGFLLPMFLTVAHRMVPFFAGSVVQGYVRWRPDWLLAALWALLGARLAGQAFAQPIIGFPADCGLFALTAAMSWKWWPRAAAPGLLKVLIWGFAWAPMGLGLSALATAGLRLGLAPVHALTIGFAASLLVAMVTRVTQGHSGQALAMSATAWLAFGAIQLAAVLRVYAALRFENGTALVAAALVLVGGLLPWLVRNALIYVRERSDGRPG
ncbi:MAG: NnrS family protein [Novosphingobium sp.]